MLERLLKTKSAQTDIEISYHGQQIWKSLAHLPVTKEEILRIQDLHGYDIATWVLYQYFKEQPVYKNFSQFLDKQQKDTYSRDHSQYLVAVFAHNPWESFAKNNDYLIKMKNTAIDAGFDFICPEIKHQVSVYENMQYYRSVLNKYADRKILLFTYAQSSLEMRLLLEKELIDTSRICGWLSVSGLVHGTALSPSSDDKMMALKRWMTLEYPVHPDVSRSTPYAHPAICKQYDIPMVSVLSFLPTKFMSFSEQARARDLVHWGPHNTYSSHLDFLNDDHVIWPLWDESHFVNLDIYKHRMQAAFQWLMTQKMPAQ